MCCRINVIGQPVCSATIYNKVEWDNYTQLLNYLIEIN